eukprot:1431972-Amphidinium_carterae.2
MDSVDFWSKAFKAYLEVAPRFMAERQTFYNHMTRMTETAIGADAIPVLAAVVEDVGRLSAILPEAIVKPLRERFLHVLGLTWTSLEKDLTGGQGHQALASDCMKVLSAAATACPFDTNVNDMVSNCADILQQTGLATLVADLKTCLGGVNCLSETETENKGNRQEWMALLAGKCQSIHLPVELRTGPELEPELQKVYGALVSWLHAQLCGNSIDVPEQGMCLVCLGGVAKLLEDKTKEVGVKTLHATQTVVDAQQRLASTLEKLEPASDILEHTVGLRRKLMKYDAFKGQQNGLTAEQQKGIDGLIEAASKDFENSKKSLCEGASTCLQQAVTDLKPIALGAPESKSWLDTFNGATFEDLLKHYVDTLEQMSGRELVKKTAAVEKALAHPIKDDTLVGAAKNLHMTSQPLFSKQQLASQDYSRVFESVDGEVDSTLTSEAVALVNKSVVTKEQNPDSLRDKVTSELKDLKTRGLQHKDCLHKLLLSRWHLKGMEADSNKNKNKVFLKTYCMLKLVFSTGETLFQYCYGHARLDYFQTRGGSFCNRAVLSDAFECFFQLQVQC